VEARLEAGRGTALDTERARAFVEGTAAGLPALESALARARMRLAVLCGRPPSAFDDRLAGPLEPATVDAILEDHGSPVRPVLVGHDPDFTELVAVLCGAAGVPMRKGAFARVEVDRPLQPGAGTLRWLVPPDLLKPER